MNILTAIKQIKKSVLTSNFIVGEGVEQKMSLTLAGCAMRRCPKCNSFNFWINSTTIGEWYEICENCGYTEKEKDARSFRKVGNKPFNPRNYVKDIDGEYHYHGKFGFHKKSVKHRRIKGQLYAFSKIKEKEK